MVLCTSNPRAGKAASWDSLGLVNQVTLIGELQIDKILCLQGATWPSWDDSRDCPLVSTPMLCMDMCTCTYMNAHIHLLMHLTKGRKVFQRRQNLNRLLCRASRSHSITRMKTFGLVIHPLSCQVFGSSWEPLSQVLGEWWALWCLPLRDQALLKKSSNTQRITQTITLFSSWLEVDEKKVQKSLWQHGTGNEWSYLWSPERVSSNWVSIKGEQLDHREGKCFQDT